VNVQRSNSFIDQDMLMTDHAYNLVQSGVPFRDAYVKVKSSQDPQLITQPLSRKNSSSGSPYNLDLKILKSRLQKLTKPK
jgi:argininosuccinate lyase